MANQVQATWNTLMVVHVVNFSFGCLSFGKIDIVSSVVIQKFFST